MNILVTGATGFVGSQLCKQLDQETDHTIVGLTHSQYQEHLIQGDVSDYPRMLEIIGDYDIDQIYHCAAKSIVRNCCWDPLGCFQTNVMGTAAILEAARQSDRIKGVLCIESDKSYGSGPTPYKEDQALNPTSIYEASKACVNHLVQTYHYNYGLPVFSVRPANVYGPGDPNKSRLVPNTITRLAKGEQPLITAGARDFLREFIYIGDIVWYLQALMDKGPWGEAINIGSGETSTIVGVVELICELMGEAFEPAEWDKPNTLREIPEQSLDLTKLHGHLPGRPLTSLRQGLEKAIKWYS